MSLPCARLCTLPWLELVLADKLGRDKPCPYYHQRAVARQAQLAINAYGLTPAREWSIKMSLEMKSSCQQCQAELLPDGAAYICSYECTFCRACAEALNAVCPNCGGELLRRPRRSAPVTPGG